MPKHIVVKLWKTEDKEKKSWKKQERNDTLSTGEKQFEWQFEFSGETLDVRTKRHTFQVLKKKIQNFLSKENVLQKWKDTQDLSDEGKLREVFARRPTLKEWLNEVH